MAKAFFREQYHYTVDEISQRRETTVEEARHLLGILKKYGIVKAVKTPKPGYEELPGQDMVLADVLEYNPNVEYAFGFVGVVMLEGHVFKSMGRITAGFLTVLRYPCICWKNIFCTVYIPTVMRLWKQTASVKFFGIKPLTKRLH